MSPKWKWLEGNFKNGLLSSKNCKIMYCDGYIQYYGDMLRGKKNGFGSLYHLKGGLYYRGEFIDDIPTLNYPSYTPNGKLSTRYTSLNGTQKVFGLINYPNGQIRYLGFWKANNPDDSDFVVIKKDGRWGYRGPIQNGKTADHRWHFRIF